MERKQRPQHQKKKENDPMRETQQGKTNDEVTREKGNRFKDATVGQVNLHHKSRKNNQSNEEGRGYDIPINYDKIRWPNFPHNLVLSKKTSLF